jgi:hypothetical protein
MGQTTITIGSGTTLGPSPFQRNYNYAWSQHVFLQSEINFTGNITQIAFDNTVGSVTSWTNQKIWMKHTSSSTITTSRPTVAELNNDWILVFEGTINYNQNWTPITLVTPFEYNNSDNVLIYYANRSNTNRY